MPNDRENADSPDSADAGGLAPGVVVNDSYRVLSLIGKGGMGAVYRVNQIMLGKDFAMKVLDLRRSSDVAVRRFQQEAKTTSQLRHPNLVEVHDFGVFGSDHPFLVMDLVEGVSLSELLKSKGALPINFVIDLAIQICFGLIYAHDKGVVHRDIKPGNIMLLHPDKPVTEGTVKIVDFGIAKLTQSDDGEIQALTRTGEIFGSPVYMSPEQCKGTAVDRRSDIYSLGCVVFECLTGSPPFFGDSAMSTMMKRLTEEPVSLKEGSLGLEFPPALETIVRKMLAVEPDKRYQELGAVIKDLMAVQRPEDKVAVSQASEEIEKKDSAREFALLLVAVALVSIVCTAAVDGYVIFPKDLERERQARELKQQRVAQAENDRQTHEDERVAEAKAKSPEVDKQYPWVVTGTDAKGLAYQAITFPKPVGMLLVEDRRGKIPAVGTITLPPNAAIGLTLRGRDSYDPNLFKNLTKMKFSVIKFDWSYAVENENIAPLERLEHLCGLDVEGSGISSLKPIYHNKLLSYLHVSNTEVPADEILKVDRLQELTNLTMGPMGNPMPVLDKLASTKKITNLVLKTSSAQAPYDANGVPPEIVAISRLTNLVGLQIDDCRRVNNASVELLTSLKKLEQLTFRKPKLTVECLDSLKKFPSLKALQLQDDGWPQADVRKATKTLPFLFEYKDIGAEHKARNDALNTNATLSEPLN